MLVLRAAYALAVTALAVVLLDEGQPVGAIAVVVLGVWLRVWAESGRMGRFAARFARSS